MIKVVLDTNVIVSANLKDSGLEAVVLRLAANRKIQLCVSPAILVEYESVLRRPKFAAFTPQQIEAALRLIRDASILLPNPPVLAVAHHEADNRFLECAQAARADFLVTGNRRHYPSHWKGIRIVNARELLEVIAPGLLPD